MRTLLSTLVCALLAGSSFSQELLVTFAANLDNAGGANRLDISGADIYSVRFDPAAQKVSDLKRLTNTLSQGEYFPSLSPDRQWVAADRLNGSVHEIILIHLASGTISSVYRNGRFPEWLNNSELLLTHTTQSEQDIYKLSLDLSAPTPKVNQTERITDRTRCPGTSIAADPFPYSGGTKILFNTLRSSGETGAAVGTINLDGTGFKLLSDWNGAGHTAPTDDGKFIVCSHSQSGKPSLIEVKTDGSTTFRNLDAPSTASAYMQQFDARFKDYAFGNYSYQTWGASDRAVFHSAQGVKEAENKALSRIVYTEYDANWQNPRVVDFSKLVEALAGKSGKDFTTTSARVIPGSGNPQVAAATAVYLNFVTHNEPTDPLEYEKNQADFNASAALVREFGQLITTKNARWNLQTAPKFLLGVIKWENAVSNATDVLESLHNTPQIDVDPRQKTGVGYNQNIADVAYLLGTIGVDGTQTVGGFIASPAQNADWEKYLSPVKGVVYPSFSWQAEILWGAASFGHQDDALQNYGVWKPKNKSAFTTHEPANNVWFIGNGCSNVLFANTLADSILTNIKNVLQAIETGQMPADKFYSMTIMTNQRDFSAAYLQKISGLIDSLNVYALQGKIIWATLREKLDYFAQWSKDKGQAYSQFACSETPLVTAVQEIEPTAPVLTVYPNPSSDALHITSDAPLAGAALFNALGQCVLNQKAHGEAALEIDVSGFEQGLYFLRVQTTDGRRVVKAAVVGR
ncbi:MAG: hypothetical protein KIPDCIKN_04238 [Haliscomenobacter sp.]|nr:hypothetical protein [Haliscomenobacter sp.]